MANTHYVVLESDATGMEPVARICERLLAEHALAKYVDVETDTDVVVLTGHDHPSMASLSISIRREVRQGSPCLSFEYHGNELAFWLMLRTMHLAGAELGGGVRLSDDEDVRPADPECYPTFEQFATEIAGSLRDPESRASYEHTLRSFMPTDAAPGGTSRPRTGR